MSGKKQSDSKQLIEMSSVVDESLELLDPTPDIQQLFLEFDQSYFWGELSNHCVVWEWSSRMTVYVTLYVGTEYTLT